VNFIAKVSSDLTGSERHCKVWVGGSEISGRGDLYFRCALALSSHMALWHLLFCQRQATEDWGEQNKSYEI